jgi:hypothetical protein
VSAAMDMDRAKARLEKSGKMAGKMLMKHKDDPEDWQTRLMQRELEQ